MKKISILCSALAMAALSFTSCQKEESYIANQQFIASFEQAGNDKVTVDNDLQMYWSTEEQNKAIFVYAPGFSTNDAYYECTIYRPTDISSNGKTAVLEYDDSYAPYGFGPFPAGQQGPFYAMTNTSWFDDSHINTDGSFHVGYNDGTNSEYFGIMPMIARADNFGTLKFKHLFGMLKVYVNLPEGFEVSEVIASFPSGYTCDVYWDANDNISLANIDGTYSQGFSTLRHGNGFYYVPVCPGVWGDLWFHVAAVDRNQNVREFQKDMKPNATITIERAGITTLTLNYTENDMVD